MLWVGTVYRKTLTLSSGALAEENAGRIVTLMSNDAQKIQARARAPLSARARPFVRLPLVVHQPCYGPAPNEALGSI